MVPWPSRAASDCRTRAEKHNKRFSKPEAFYSLSSRGSTMPVNCQGSHGKGLAPSIAVRHAFVKGDRMVPACWKVLFRSKAQMAALNGPTGAGQNRLQGCLLQFCKAILAEAVCSSGRCRVLAVDGQVLQMFAIEQGLCSPIRRAGEHWRNQHKNHSKGLIEWTCVKMGWDSHLKSKTYAMTSMCRSNRSVVAY